MGDDLRARARRLWEELAGDGAEFPEPGDARVLVRPGSRLCPPGWVGAVRIGGALLVTAPTAADAGRVAALLPVDDLGAIAAGLAPTDTLGPAELAYVDSATFRDRQPSPADDGGLADGPGSRRHSAALAAGRGPAAGQPAEGGSAALAAGREAGVRLPADDPDLRRLYAEVEPDELTESGLDGLSPFVARDGERVLAAAGYARWPAGVAHVCVLTAADARGRGLATAVAAAATADALAAGLLPQWRARVPASLRVAAKLGYRTLGQQASVLLGSDPAAIPS